MKNLPVFFLILFLFPQGLLAWNDHVNMTRLALEPIEGTLLPTAVIAYESVENVLAVVKSSDGSAIRTIEIFGKIYGIHTEKVKWEWAGTKGKPLTAREILAYSSMEVDDGMDQDLHLSDDQQYMGGYTGLSSQGFRHMYYEAFTPSRLSTFHFPTHEMGQSPERALAYFELALACEKADHHFWAYRFLGWGLHYVEDLGQPYHANQFASLRLLPLMKLLKGWKAFIAETTRIVGNFHLSFEEYADYILETKPDSRILMSFRLPAADKDFSKYIGQAGPKKVKPTMLKLATTSNELASVIVAAQIKLMGEELFLPDMDIISGFRDSNGIPKIAFETFLKNAANEASLKKFDDALITALSNTSIAARWFVETFVLEASSEMRKVEK